MTGPRAHHEQHPQHGELGRVVGYWVAPELVEAHLIAGWTLLAPHLPPDRAAEFALMRAPDDGGAAACWVERLL